MADSKKDTAVDAGKMQSEQQKTDLKTAYLKAKAKALAENPDLLSTSIPEFTEGMDLKAAFDRLSFVTGGQGSAKPGVRSRSSLDKIAPDAPESIMPGRPVVLNAQQLEKARAIGRKVSGKPLKGTVVSGSNAAFDSPEYAAAAQPGGLREQERDAELPAIQKAVFGSPQVGDPGSDLYVPASKNFQAASRNYKAATPDQKDENGQVTIKGTPQVGTPQIGDEAVGTAPSADFKAGVAGQGYYDTPYGRISAKKGRVGDVTTPTDTHRKTLINQLKSKGITYNEDAKKGSEANPFYRGRMKTDGKENDDFSVNKEADTMDAAERKMLGYDLPGSNKTAGEDPETTYSYYGPLGDGPQNKVTNPTMDDYDKANAKLFQSNPSLFKKDTPQNKRFVAKFNKDVPDYYSLDKGAQIRARTYHMNNLDPNLLNDPAHFGENPPGVTPLEPSQPSVPVETSVGPGGMQPLKKP